MGAVKAASTAAPGNEENVICEKIDAKSASAAAPAASPLSLKKEIVSDPLNVSSLCQTETSSEVPAPIPLADDLVPAATVAPAAPLAAAAPVPEPVTSLPAAEVAVAAIPAVVAPIPVSAAPIPAVSAPTPAVAAAIPVSAGPLPVPAASISTPAVPAVPAPVKVNPARIRCLEDPLYMFSNPPASAGGIKGASVASMEPVAPKGPRYRVLEAPSDEMNVSPTSLALSTSATSSPYKVLEAPLSPTLSSPSSANRSLASDVLEKARTRFDRFWTKKECDK